MSFFKQFSELFTWKKFKKFSVIVQFCVVIFGVCFSVAQFRDVRNMQSAELMLTFNKELISDKNAKILTALEDNLPIFIENGGSFDTTDIDNYLSVFELLNNAYLADLMTDDMIYNAFYFSVTRTYQNKEIQNYLQTIRKENENYFTGFERLAKSFLISN